MYMNLDVVFFHNRVMVHGGLKGWNAKESSYEEGKWNTCSIIKPVPYTSHSQHEIALTIQIPLLYVVVYYVM